MHLYQSSPWRPGLGWFTSVINCIASARGRLQWWHTETIQHVDSKQLRSTDDPTEGFAVYAGIKSRHYLWKTASLNIIKIISSTWLKNVAPNIYRPGCIKPNRWRQTLLSLQVVLQQFEAVNHPTNANVWTSHYEWGNRGAVFVTLNFSTIPWFSLVYCLRNKRSDTCCGRLTCIEDNSTKLNGRPN